MTAFSCRFRPLGKTQWADRLRMSKIDPLLPFRIVAILPPIDQTTDLWLVMVS